MKRIQHPLSTRRLWKLALAVGVAAPICAGTIPVAWAKHKPGEYRWITAALSSGNAHRQKEAIKLMDHLIHRPAHYALPYRLAYNWLPLLQADGHFTTAATLARENVLNNPGATTVVDLSQTVRVEALLALGKTNAALRNAKSLFNVCTLADTQQALLLLRQCLTAKYPQGHKLIHLFITQQIAGARMPKGGPCSVLGLIHIKAAVYKKALQKLHGQSRAVLLAKGNLLLLAGDGRKALSDFHLISALAWRMRDFLACQNDIVRAIKTEDGTVGRANAHLLAAARRLQRQ